MRLGAQRYFFLVNVGVSFFLVGSKRASIHPLVMMTAASRVAHLDHSQPLLRLPQLLGGLGVGGAKAFFRSPGQSLRLGRLSKSLRGTRTRRRFTTPKRRSLGLQNRRLSGSHIPHAAATFLKTVSVLPTAEPTGTEKLAETTRGLERFESPSVPPLLPSALVGRWN